MSLKKLAERSFRKQLEDLVSPMACGHPKACLNKPLAREETTLYCRWCEDVARLKKELYQERVASNAIVECGCAS